MLTPDLTRAVCIVFACAALGHSADAVPLFNGKDLQGWTGAAYEVRDGVLICRGKILRTEKQFTNYVLEFDVLLPPRGNNGIGIHYPGTGRPSHTQVHFKHWEVAVLAVSINIGTGEQHVHCSNSQC